MQTAETSPSATGQDLPPPETHEDPHRQHFSITFAVLAFSAIIYALLQSLIAPALPEIQADLHTTASTVSWLLTGYLLSASVATPIIGRLGDMFGKERALVAVLVLLGVGVVMSGLAHSIGLMIAGRVIQGAGGAVFPLAFGIIRDEFPSARVPSALGLISAIMGIGGGAGIVLAGPITSAFNYHWLFWFPLFGVGIALVATILFVPESPVKTPGRVNLVGAGLLSAWLVVLLYGVTKGADWGWTSAMTLGCFALAVLLIVTWVLTERRSDEPLVDMRMMANPGVMMPNVVGLLLGAGMYSSFILIPQFVELPTSTGFGFGASVTQAGLFLLPSTLTMMFAGGLAGRLAGTIGSRLVLAIGAAMTGAPFLLLALAHGHKLEFYGASLLLGFGIGMSFAAMANLVVQAVPPTQTGIATGMNTIARSVGGAIGTQVVAAVIAARVDASTHLPTESGFVLSYLMAAAALVVAAVMALVIGRRSALVARAGASV